MVKRTIVLVCIIVASLGGLLILSPLVRNASVQENATLATLPTDAILIARVNNWKGLLEQQRSLDTLWSLLGYSDPGRLVRRLSHAFDSLRVENPDMFASVSPNECALSWHAMGQKSLSALVVFQLHNAIKAEEVMGALYPSAIPIASQAYAGTKIVSFTFDERNNTQTWHAASKANLCYIASSRILLENALRMPTAEHNLLDEAGFARVVQSSSNHVAWNAFLQLPRYAPHVAPQLNGIWQRLVRESAQWCTWLELDISEEGSALSVQGVSLVEKEKKNTSNKYADAKSTALSSPSLLPETCPVFFRWGDRNSERLHTQIATQSSNTNSLSQTLIAKAEIQELTLAWEEQSGLGSWLVVVAPRSTSHAFGTIRTELSTGDAHSHLQSLRIDSETELSIATSAHPDYFQRHFGTPFSKEVGKYYAVVDRYIVFSSNIKTIERVALAKARGQTLEASAHWKDIKDQLQSQCNFMYYSSPCQRKDFSSLFFSTQSVLRTGRGARLSNSLAGIVLQVSGAGKILFYNGIFQQSKSLALSSVVATGWETRLEGNVVGRPICVTNHNTKALEVLVQDTNGKLYLINAEGRVLWRAQLEGEILGSPRQVDLFHNNKLQYIFCTRNKLYAVDRNGNMVDGFPVRLPAETYSPLAIFDYEGKRDYRFVVSCSNRRIYMYDRTGKRIMGFTPPQMETSTHHPLVWFSSHEKDYIVACDSSRIYFLNRRGEERLRTKRSVARAHGAPLGVEFGISPRVVTVSEEGELCIINTVDGDVRRVAVPSWQRGSTGHLTDLNGDGVLELIYTRGKELIAVNQLGNIIYRTTFDGELDDWVQTFRFSDHDIRIGVYSASAQKLWLVNASGNISVGYPLDGNSPFSIGTLVKGRGIFNLLVGKENTVKNYEIKP